MILEFFDDEIFTWSRYGLGYECSTAGDTRFSAFNALMRDGRSIEVHYHCDIKGYDVGGTNWSIGKGKPPKNGKSKEQLKTEYIGLWKDWASRNPELIKELELLAREYNCNLTDQFATTECNQAMALSVILNERINQNSEFKLI